MSRLATFFLVIGLAWMTFYALRDVPRMQEAMVRSAPLAESAMNTVSEFVATAQGGMPSASDWADSVFSSELSSSNDSFAAEADAVRNDSIDQLTDIAIAAGAPDDCFDKTVRELDAPCLKMIDTHIAEAQAELVIAENALRDGKASVTDQSLTAEEAVSLREEIATATYFAIAAGGSDTCLDIPFGDMSDECKEMIESHLDIIESQIKTLRSDIRAQLQRIR